MIVTCPCGGIGRRSRLKICHSQGCEGSIPFVGTFFFTRTFLKAGFLLPVRRPRLTGISFTRTSFLFLVLQLFVRINDYRYKRDFHLTFVWLRTQLFSSFTQFYERFSLFLSYLCKPIVRSTFVKVPC